MQERKWREQLQQHKKRLGNKGMFMDVAYSISKTDIFHKPSDILRKKWQRVLDEYIPKERQAELLVFLDKYHEFPYTTGLYRRTVRSKGYNALDYKRLQEIFEGYYNMSFYAESMAEYYGSAATARREEAEKQLWEYISIRVWRPEDLIAAELDGGKTKLAELLEDILMSENNTNVVTADMIRGIVKSNNGHLHKLLGDFLLAARLQEGVRQAVCENMDAGTAEAFLVCLRVITENDLIRFSAVKRAVSTWTGLCDEKHLERISDKQLTILEKAFQERKYLKELLCSNDSMELYLGLWVQGFFEVEDAIKSCERLVKEGTRNQKLVAAYYNRAVQNHSLVMRTARLVIEQYPEDVELCAAFFPTYLSAKHLRLETDSLNTYHVLPKRAAESMDYRRYFESKKQAKQHFGLLMRLREAVLPRGRVFSPCIFPWYSAEIYPADVAERIVRIADMLEDEELTDAACSVISELEVSVRWQYLKRLLAEPKTGIQRRTLLMALGDKAQTPRQTAFELVSELTLGREDYKLLLGLLKYKAADTRKYVLQLLMGQPDELLADSVKVLLADKSEEMRLGGLDLLVRLKKDEKRQKLFCVCKEYLNEMSDVTEKEAVIRNELTGSSQAEGVLNEKGYGLYRPDAAFVIPEFRADKERILHVLRRNKEELYAILDRLEALYHENRLLTYVRYDGDEMLLENSFDHVLRNRGAKEEDPLDYYPYPELWRCFYEEHIRDFETLLNLVVFIQGSERRGYSLSLEWFQPMAEKLYGEDYLNVNLSRYSYRRSLVSIMENLYMSYSRKEENRRLLLELAESMFAFFMSEPVTLSWRKRDESDRVFWGEDNYYAMDTDLFSRFTSALKEWKTNEEFDRMFTACLNINRFYGQNAAGLSFLNYIKAYRRGMLSLDNVYQAAFDFVGLKNMLWEVSRLFEDSGRRFGREERYIRTEEGSEGDSVFQTAIDIYWNIVEMILKVELKRSEMPTVFSEVIGSIGKVRGAAHLVDILTALGKDTLERSVYYSYGRGNEKKLCLSHLLYVSEPLPGENAETLRQLLKERQLPDKRLVEAAMYNSKWIDVIEEYLGWQGLKSGIYYFIAHMNERFSDRTAAIIAKYTPLTPEELNDGAFDLDWFLECSRRLGDKRFKMLYDSAKYISDSNKHTRARKYADAVQEKVTAEKLEQEIAAKRNKDLLMSYALVPIKQEREVLQRYQFIRKYIKDSKQFGAQRRASEVKAAEMALQNLAIRAGYADVTRLTLNVEVQLAEEMKRYFEWQQVEDVLVKIAVGEEGKPAVVCEKAGKVLKAVPTALKKNEKILELQAYCRQLKEQYTRTKVMLEQFMEDGTEFTAVELEHLQNNPVICPLLKSLLFIAEDRLGFFMNGALLDAEGKESHLEAKTQLRVAHPFDLWSRRLWPQYQKLLFEQQTRQPFKQVFRELYVKTQEEEERYNSLRYAGNQIQPDKAFACLRSRRWIADYENGLQKVYYKENIVASIYALADWFSPSDIEAPTVEWVCFYDRKNFQQLRLKEIPDRIFSEVMRDVDLAVSVAHAGGVDPETSHSTIEMRRAIAEFNLPLFNLNNVTLAGSHALIAGKRANYTVHLGSGVVFKQGGAQIVVLPVHSQHRGKLFLPFIDEDPKTAEIMSKIVLFAEDGKIKDPYILQQLER